ncbi:hypothetical protein NP493_374g01029 [Ridgeia piscesae]|uniref:Cytochrome b5 heme-binding domain-containing protein n=1 Tax=Ridgeia piscesae TaxID=27915 RepID=A0AAD9L374_RIDPI|nr:hypothetical protein NP493_374g01029 [Ridgeia piscesae]
MEKQRDENETSNETSCDLKPSYTWDEIKAHSTKNEQWIVINNCVYDVTRWLRKHPGGAKILSHFAGQDASDAWAAFHIDHDYCNKFLTPLFKGTLAKDEQEEKEMNRDFRELRKKVKEMGLMKANPWFFLGYLVHVILLDVAAFCTLWYFGTGWIPWLTTVALLTVSQIQTGWMQHDYGHHSVLPTAWLNRVGHWLTIGVIKGASAHWWNFRHSQHHAKPNCLRMDPDISVGYLFLMGDHLPVQLGRKKKGYMPYQQQHNYFWLLGPPVLLPIYFHLEVIYFIIKRRAWVDFAWMLCFYVRFFYMYSRLLGAWGAFTLYMLERFIESHWFLFVTQSNHVPMEIDKDHQHDWPIAQTISTCNIAGSPFNDWFTGHLNYQVEHQ